MNEFKTYHPIVNFLYFAAVIGFSMFLMHPVCLVISFVCGFTYSVCLGGKQAVKSNLLYMLPMMLAAALMNPLFNHEGATILRYLPGGNPLTLESLAYGAAAAVMIVSVICHFFCYTAVMTSDKFIYLFGKIIPSLSLIFSMTLRFVPRFIEQIKIVTDAQRCIGRDISSGTLVKRAKNGLAILSVMATWALESTVETADSMKARGYGLRGRSAFSVFKFTKRDAAALVYICVTAFCVLIGAVYKKVDFAYFPMIEGSGTDIWSIIIFAAYFALCIMPVIIEVAEVMRWKALESKI